MRKAAPYIAGLAVVVVLTVLAYQSGPRRRPIDPLPLKGGDERDNRAIGEIDLEKLYPGLVLRSSKGPEKIVALTFDDGHDKVYTPGPIGGGDLPDRQLADEDADVAKRSRKGPIGNQFTPIPNSPAPSSQELERTKEARPACISDNGFFRPPTGR